jgi:pantoate--beta-alanine ligase
LHGERVSLNLNRFIRTLISRESSGKIDYIACVDAGTLAPLQHLRGKVLIALAVTFGKTRLIDNIIFSL